MKKNIEKAALNKVAFNLGFDGRMVTFQVLAIGANEVEKRINKSIPIEEIGKQELDIGELLSDAIDAVRV